uniref:Peptidylprolyl isomerase (cyclophilin)-like 3 n=1 Tax=Sinocyclocheilus grahami TaxID=75366 RepID=A0A672T6K0_SINGR
MNLGDIKIELFWEKAPKSCEDTCTGKGGTSIWGRKFEDEFSDHLKVSQCGVVAMANNGPDTNASQFYFTYAKQPHLDMKYTVFGKYVFFCLIIKIQIYPGTRKLAKVTD